MLTFLKNTERAGFDELVEAVFGEVPKRLVGQEAVSLDRKVYAFYRALGKLRECGYVKSCPDPATRQVFFQVRSGQETEILLTVSRGLD